MSEGLASMASKKIFIYGAGFYGSCIESKTDTAGDVVCIVDRNPPLHGTWHLGLPVMPPVEVEVVYAGVNPLSARSIVENVSEWHDRSIKRLCFDDTK